ncbi:MAG: DegT/DnrJ/EryC1/StrS family aminotransferase, partial [Planctomycetota bacterium]
HFAGLPGDMDEITALAKRRKIALIEDCAHAPGARYRGRHVGGVGAFGCFSFHTIKNMTTLGEGGMIVTNDAKAAYDIPRLRWVGTTLYEKQERYWLPFLYDVQRVRGHVPHNFNMNEVCASVGRVQLAKLDEMNERRRRLARKLSEKLSGIEGVRVPVEPADRTHVYHLYNMLFDGSGFGATVDDLIALAYDDHGVQIVPHYLPTYRFSIYRDGTDWEGRCPTTRKVYSQLATLPFAGITTEKEIDIIAKAVRASVRKLQRRPLRSRARAGRKAR